MKYRFKLLLLLLLLTLPLRGVAAVTACGAPMLHHDAVSAASQTDMAAAPHDAAPSSHDHHRANPADKPATAYGGCGASCTGTISEGYGSVPPIGVIPSSAVITFFAHPYAGFIPEGPERPPRTFLC